MLELLLAVSLVAVASFGVVSSIIVGQTGSVAAAQRGHALHIAEEGLEAARSMRAVSFDSLAVGNWGLARSGGWQLTVEPETIGMYERTLDISAPSPDERVIVSRVAWRGVFGDDEIAFETRLTRYR